MHALRLHGPGDLRLHEEPEPEPAEGHDVVRVTAVGICGSDLHWLEDGSIGEDRITRPLVLGHELAGVVASGPRAGMRVAVDPAISCGDCTSCREGHPNLCAHTRFAGHGAVDGGFQTFLRWPTRFLFPLPDTITDADGAVLEPLGVAVHAVDLGHVRAGSSVGVFGCGPVGLLIAQVARAAGATQLFATDVRAHRLEAALRFGATDAFLADASRSEAGAVRARTGGQGVDVAFEAAGDNDAVEAAIEAVRPGGRVVLVGIPSDDRTGFTASVARRKGLTLLVCRRMKHVYPRALALAEQGLVDTAALVSHTYALADYQAAFDTAVRREGLKVVIDPSA